MPVEDTRIRFRCSHCGQRFKVDEGKGGQQFPCPRCGRIVVVPIPASMAPHVPAGVAKSRAVPAPAIKFQKDNEAIAEIFEVAGKAILELEMEVQRIIRSQHLGPAEQRERLRDARLACLSTVLEVARKYMRQWERELYRAGADSAKSQQGESDRVRSVRRKLEELRAFAETVLGSE